MKLTGTFIHVIYIYIYIYIMSFSMIDTALGRLAESRAGAHELVFTVMCIDLAV
jgi:hypothetical protein